MASIVCEIIYRYPGWVCGKVVYANRKKRPLFSFAVPLALFINVRTCRAWSKYLTQDLEHMTIPSRQASANCNSTKAGMTFIARRNVQDAF